MSKPKPSQTLSDQLRALLTGRGTAHAIGRRSGVDKCMIARFLAGERSLTLTTVDRLAAELGIRLVEVAGRRRDRGPP